MGLGTVEKKLELSLSTFSETGMFAGNASGWGCGLWGGLGGGTFFPSSLPPAFSVWSLVRDEMGSRDPAMRALSSQFKDLSIVRVPSFGFSFLILLLEISRVVSVVILWTLLLYLLR